MGNMDIWNKVSQPPPNALKAIQSGRLKGKSDINPQWRYQAMTELFGPCGVGWKYKIERVWTEAGSENQVMAFAEVHLFIKHEGEWSEPIPGVGGSMAVAKEKSGPHTSDECFKMAITDALSVSLKMLGVAADVYAGLWDGAKYLNQQPTQPRNGSKSPREMMFEALTKAGLSRDEMADLSRYLIALEEGGKLRPETMKKVAENTQYYINEWKSAKEDIPY